MLTFFNNTERLDQSAHVCLVGSLGQALQHDDLRNASGTLQCLKSGKDPKSWVNDGNINFHICNTYYL